MVLEAEIDESVLRRAASGNREAVVAFVRRYERLVFRTAARILSSEADVEDVSQEAFLRALAALERFDSTRESRVSTWLATIAVRLSLDTLRKRVKLVALENLAEEQLASLAEPADALIDAAQRQAALALAVSQLNPEQRAVLVLRIEHEMPLEAIADALDIELGTVKSRLARARTALASALADTLSEGVDHG